MVVKKQSGRDDVWSYVVSIAGAFQQVPALPTFSDRHRRPCLAADVSLTQILLPSLLSSQLQIHYAITRYVQLNMMCCSQEEAGLPTEPSTLRSQMLTGYHNDLKDLTRTSGNDKSCHITLPLCHVDIPHRRVTELENSDDLCPATLIGISIIEHSQ